MARTVAGRRLTEAHKHAQIGLSANFSAASNILRGEIDAANLDVSVAGWLPLQVLLAETFYRDSARLGNTYLTEFRSAEVSAAGASDMPVRSGVFDAAGVAGSAAVFAPMAKKMIGDGKPAVRAVDETFWALVATMGVEVLAGGRDVVGLSALANPDSVGWRRVSDGRPCAWCAMLVARGPAYRTAKTAALGRRYHDRCGCTVEEVFGRWKPTAGEQKYVDLYDNSYREGMNDSRVASMMRRNGDGVVNDALVK